jgi:hypothetical protein
MKPVALEGTFTGNDVIQSSPDHKQFVRVGREAKFWRCENSPLQPATHAWEGRFQGCAPRVYS